MIHYIMLQSTFVCYGIKTKIMGSQLFVVKFTAVFSLLIYYAFLCHRGLYYCFIKVYRKKIKKEELGNHNNESNNFQMLKKKIFHPHPLKSLKSCTVNKGSILEVFECDVIRRRHGWQSKMASVMQAWGSRYASECRRRYPRYYAATLATQKPYLRSRSRVALPLTCKLAKMFTGTGGGPKFGGLHPRFGLRRRLEKLARREELCLFCGEEN